MPVPEGFTKKGKLKRWIKALAPGTIVKVSEVSNLSGIEISKPSLFDALSEFAMNNLLVKVDREIYQIPKKENHEKRTD